MSVVLRLVPPPSPASDADELLFDDDGALDLAIDLELADPHEVLRRDVYHGLVHCIVSNQALWSTVDVALLPDVLSPTLSTLPQQPLALQGLWDHLVLERATAREHAAETLLLFHGRASRWGVTMTLPQELEQLSPEKRQRAVTRLRERGGGTGTHVGPAPTRPPASRPQKAPLPAAPKPAAKPASPSASKQASPSSSKTAPKPASSSSSKPAPKTASSSSSKPAAKPSSPTAKPATTSASSSSSSSSLFGSGRLASWLLRGAFAATLALGLFRVVASGDDHHADAVITAMEPVCRDLRFSGRVALCNVADAAPSGIERARLQMGAVGPAWTGEIILVVNDDPV